MGRQMGKRLTWVLENFSSLKEEYCYSGPFTVSGGDWRLVAYPKGDGCDGYLSVYLDLAPKSLPPGWRKDVKFRITLVNDWGKSNNVLEGQGCFDAEDSNWGFKEFLPLSKLSGGFLVNDRLIILADLLIFPAILLPLKTIQPLCSKQADASISKSQVDSSCPVAQKSDNTANQNLDVDDASEEGSDEDYTSEESSDEDYSSEESSDEDYSSEEDSDDDSDASSSSVSDDGGTDINSLNQSNALEDASHTVKRCNSVTAETEVSNCENDDAPKEDVDDEASSHVSNDSAISRSSLDQVKSLEDASQTVENGRRGLETVESVTGTCDNVVKEIQPVNETMEINGFEVFSSQVESVSHIFKRHPDIATGFRPKNQQIRRAYMNALLSLIEMLCQSPEKLTENDLSNADDTLVDLTDVGFKLDWLKTKLNEISEKKKMGSGARLKTMEEQLQELKKMFLDLESQLQKEKVEALAAKAPLSFNDIVC